MKKWLIRIAGMILLFTIGIFLGDYLYIHQDRNWLSPEELAGKYLSERYIRKYPDINVTLDGEQLSYLKTPISWRFNRADGFLSPGEIINRKYDEIPAIALKAGRTIEITGLGSFFAARIVKCGAGPIKKIEDGYSIWLSPDALGDSIITISCLDLEHGVINYQFRVRTE